MAMQVDAFGHTAGCKANNVSHLADRVGSIDNQSIHGFLFKIWGSITISRLSYWSELANQHRQTNRLEERLFRDICGTL